MEWQKCREKKSSVPSGEEVVLATSGPREKARFGAPGWLGAMAGATGKGSGLAEPGWAGCHEQNKHLSPREKGAVFDQNNP
jgi:hypothetical protein